VLYFAYGSNMNWAQMRERCPSAQYIRNACLRDHRLAFTRFSKTWNGGVADAMAAGGCKLWGVVYDISDEDITNLDKTEGYRTDRLKNAYWRRLCTVFQNEENEGALSVSAYFAEREADFIMPSAAYINRILTGARHWRLPENYIREIESIAFGNV